MLCSKDYNLICIEKGLLLHQKVNYEKARWKMVWNVNEERLNLHVLGA